MLKKLFDFSEEKREKSGREQKKIYETVKMWDEDHQIPMITETVNGLLLLQGCCKRAYIRGAFLAGVKRQQKRQHKNSAGMETEYGK